MLTPRWYQAESDEAFWQHLCTQAGNPIEVLPTGAGKSLVIAMHCQRAVKEFKGRVIVLAHRKELLVQNANKIKELLPGMDIGIYSAGLGSRDVDHDVVLGGIQSVYNKAHLFGQRQLVLVDEVHLVGDEGMYRTFLTDLRKLNPNIRVGGLTATPFRTGEGKIVGPNRLFQAICYSASISRLIAEGFLSRLITEPTDFSVDTSKLHVRGGEFVASEMVQLFEGEEKVNAACVEIVANSVGRRSTLIFCPSVFHAMATQKKIEQLTGEECGIVIGDTPPLERASTLDRFKTGRLKRCVNVDVLTTGFDAPSVDCIAVLRATMSPGLFAQICGRGLRTAPAKTDCLILDFGENCKRHGPIDSDTYGFRQESKRGDGTGEAPQKTCPSCEESCPISARECECGWQFPPPEVAKHGINADGSPILEADVKPDRWEVIAVNMGRHRKKKAEGDAPDTLRVDYTCRLVDGGDMTEKTVSEWVCLEHEGYAGTKARLWWSARSLAPCNGIDDAIDLWKRGAVAAPAFLTTRPDGRFTKIVSVELDDKPETWSEESEVKIVDAFEEAEVPF
jgi:DNA repair protein RadD